MAPMAVAPSAGVLPPPAAIASLATAPARAGAVPQRAGRTSSTAATAAAAAASGFAAALALSGRREGRDRRGRVRCRQSFRDGSEGKLIVDPEDDKPKNLYELFRLPSGANKKEIKKAYYDLQKKCHPDVAGEEGEEMCILLNDAYDTLTDGDKKVAYDEQLKEANPLAFPEKTGIAAPQDISNSLEPTWQWKPKKHGHKPIWTGEPKSRSMHSRVPPEDRGSKHFKQEFVFVDEFSCIACRNCCDIAPKTFCIDAEHGRARVYTQWSHSEEYLDYAVASCPVDCIHWVSREELQVLEHVTAEKLYEGGANALPCPMAVRQGMAVQTNYPFEMAKNFQERLKRKEERYMKLNTSIDRFQRRIQEVFSSLSRNFKQRIGFTL